MTTDKSPKTPGSTCTPANLYVVKPRSLREYVDFIWYRIVLGRKAGSEKESNNRRGWCRLSILLIAIIALLLPAVQDLPIIENRKTIPWYLALSAFGAVVWSVVFFFLVVVVIPFRASEHFEVNAIRLGGDGLLSIALSIAAFSLAYVVFGLNAPSPEENLRLRDHIYFSAVTFSTLGFGDITPMKPARLYAAAQAIIGNLHLGLIVGTAFYAASNGKEIKCPREPQ